VKSWGSVVTENFSGVFGQLFLTSLLLSLAITPYTDRAARWLGAVDSPDDRRVHEKTMPRLGGLGVAVSLILSLLAYFSTTSELWGFLIGAVLILVTGLLDDVYQLRSIHKLLGQVLACGMFLWMTGHQIPGFGRLYADHEITFGALAPWVTLFCMVGLVNAINLIDGLDGLAAGLVSIAACFLAVLAFIHQQYWPLAILVALIGALLGFIRFNGYPASLFMGDTGSLLLGYTMAVVSVLLVDQGNTEPIAPITVALVLALPVVDTLVVMTLRLLKRKSPFSPDKTHLHHRLMLVGFHHSGAVPLLYGLMFVYGFLALSILSMPEWQQFYLGLSITIVFYVIIFSFQRFKLKSTIVGLTRPYPLILRLRSALSSFQLYFSWIYMGGLIFSLLFLGEQFQAINPLWGLLLAGMMVIYQPWKEEDKAGRIGNALAYLSIMYLVFLSNSAGENGKLYMEAFSILVMLWVLLKLVFASRYDILLTSSFEVLLIGLSWLVPYALVPVLVGDPDLVRIVNLTCIQSIVLLLGFKLLSRRNHQETNRALKVLVVLMFLVSGLPLIGNV